MLEITINNVTYWTSIQRGVLRDIMAVEKNAKVVRVAVLLSYFSREIGGFRQ